ncbi:hypothetical protein Ocin01_00857 [Orchesella cincta]|uniref:Gustatory receptor n=1 Tax=Orchesella cincta TaxID=48709 RepID=A0A1D2NLJ6_ORCCI|nr:hypothetical protein Ocin01_00857 [Orchesella cincta]
MLNPDPQESPRSAPKKRMPRQKKQSIDSSQASEPPELMGAFPFQPPDAPLPQEKKAEPDLLAQFPALAPPAQSKTASSEELNKGKAVVVVAEPEQPTEEIDYAEEWLNSFCWIRWFLILFGRFPFTYVEEKKVYQFKFTWKCPGFFFYIINSLIITYGLIASGVNVAIVLMNDKITPIVSRSNSTILEQALIQRHTMILIIMIGSYGVGTITSVFIYVKRNDIADMFTKWLKILRTSKLSGGTIRTYTYVGLVAINYLIVSTVLFILSVVPSRAKTSTLIGGPTVVSMLFMRHFNSKTYMEDFVGSNLHMVMHLLGMVLYFYVVTTCNAFMYLLLWLSKSIEIAFSGWNDRMAGLLELTANELKEKQTKKDRTTYEMMFNDHIGIVRMLSWANNAYAYILETYVLFQTIKVVYQIYLAALVISENGDFVRFNNEGKFFRRPWDQLPALLITYENAFTVVIMLMAGAYLEDTAYESYDDLRKKSLLKGYYNEKETYYFLSMFQSFTSTTKMAIYGGQFFCIDRYTILHVLSAVVSNFLVVYQFRPSFDINTEKNKEWRKTIGTFLTKFEGLPDNHIIPRMDDS